MKWLSNTYNPEDEQAAKLNLVLGLHETREEAWRNHKQWLEGKIIGIPKDTAHYSVLELIEMGMGGVYLPDEEK